MTAYDPQIIQKFVDRLYAQARTAIVTATLGGILIGAALGIVLAIGVDTRSSGLLGNLTSTQLNLAAALAGALVLGLLGFFAGLERAFRLRLQAQIALCQMKIEENTRRQ